MAVQMKRKPEEAVSSSSKKPKTYVSQPQKRHIGTAEAILPGDAGIWISCDKGREARCVTECRLLFQEFAAHYLSRNAGDFTNTRDQIRDHGNDQEDDIESAILHEIGQVRGNRETDLFENVKIQSPCLAFFKTRLPVDPSSFVKDLCVHITNLEHCGIRYTRRLTPICLFARASNEGLRDITAKTLPRYFSSKRQKYAIRVSTRNHNVMKREEIIKTVASMVGPPHTVDLKHYDLLILVDIYKHLCGIAVLDSEYEKLRKFNLAELTQDRAGSHNSGNGVVSTSQRRAE